MGPRRRLTCPAPFIATGLIDPEIIIKPLAGQSDDLINEARDRVVKANGGNYSKGADWAPYVLTDGTLITGQNPASSEQGAHALLKQLG